MAESLETAEHYIFVTQVYFCTMYGVVIWDWVISLPREWRFIWLTQWTPVKIAYLFCRYWVISVVPYLLFCFVVDHSLATCERIYRIPVTLAMWNQVGGEVVLLIRTYAFFNRSPVMLGGLVAALSGVIAYQLYVATSQMMLLPFVKPPFDKGPCFPVSKPHSAHLLGFFIAPLLFDTIVTTMTVIKAFYIRRHSGKSFSRLIQTFLREGIFYYILISIANLINGIFYLQPRQVISAINIPLTVMLGPVLACRLVLDLRERGSETVSHSGGIAAFAARTINISPDQANSSDSQYIPTHRKAGRSFGQTYPRVPGVTTTVGSNMLTTVGSVLPGDHDDGLELENIGRGFGLGLGGFLGRKESNRSMRSGLESGEESDVTTPAPAYNTVEMAPCSRPSRSPTSSGVSGIKIEIEKTTTTI